jgi:type II secretory pathway component PulM
MRISEKDRRILVIGGAIAAVLFVLAVVLPLEARVSRLHAQVARKQADLAWMRRVAPELAAAGPLGHPASGESLLVIVDQSARESGLGSALTGTGRSGEGMNVQLEHAPFDTLIAWLARLGQQNGIEVESADIHSAGPPGQVNASIVLKAP